MAQLSINLPDQHEQRIIEAVCKRYNREDVILDESGGVIPNPETKIKFVKRMMKQWLKDCVVQYEAYKAADEARALVISEITSSIAIGD